MRPEPIEVQLLHSSGCPLIERVRVALQDCLCSTGISATVEDLEGPYPSPTLLINGVDVVTGEAPRQGNCCRLDLPSHDQIVTALRQGAMR